MISLKSKAISIRHGFFTRHGGFSSHGYSSLNCSFTVGDEQENVIHNLDAVCEAIDLKKGRLIALNQVHGKDVLIVDESNVNDFIRYGEITSYTADAIVTCLTNVGIGILTADCVPVLFYDHKNHIIGAAHSGWRGAFLGVIEAAVGAMIKVGGETKNINAAIGPCIHKQSYITGFEIFDALIDQSKDNKRFFHSTETIEKKFFFDLFGYVQSKLTNLGIESIDTIDNDTFIDRDFFSYRRNNIEKQFDNCGRQISVICL